MWLTDKQCNNEAEKDFDQLTLRLQLCVLHKRNSRTKTVQAVIGGMTQT